MSDEVDLLKRVYDRFNARDMETVLAAMHEPDITKFKGQSERIDTLVEDINFKLNTSLARKSSRISNEDE